MLLERRSSMSESATRGRLTFSNPRGLYDPRPNGYSHLAQFPAGWRVILPAGQGGETEDTKLSADFRTQFRQAISNTETVLAAAGAKLADIAKINLLIVDHDREKFKVMTEEVERVWGDAKPAMTLMPVPALALEGMQVEIDVIAVIPE
jgi:enamine deaminase RidA (YjgF/YER057c/UK114 family)